MPTPFRFARSLPLLLCLACRPAPPEPPPDPEVTIATIEAALSDASAHAVAGRDTEAQAALAVARARFGAEVAPFLVDRHERLLMEHQFAVAHAQLALRTEAEHTALQRLTAQLQALPAASSAPPAP